MKKCGGTCGLIKEDSEFNKDASKNGGLASWCKACKKEANQLRQINQKDHIAGVKQKYNEAHKEEIALNHKAWQENNKESQKAKRHEYYEENKEKILQDRHEYYVENKPKILAQKRVYANNKLKTDPIYKLEKRLRSRLYAAVKGLFKAGSAVKDLGCSIEFLKQYLEAKFYPHPITGEMMTWDNWSIYGWHIDHIIPISLFDIEDREQLLRACNYINLQPLWAEENLKKSNKITPPKIA